MYNLTCQLMHEKKFGISGLCVVYPKDYNEVIKNSKSLSNGSNRSARGLSP
jgi:hypothetical protein